MIIRQTNGWIDARTGKRKTRDRISHSQFIEKTGLCSKIISKATQCLVLKGLVEAGYGKSRLRYWAMLMKNWTKAEPFSRLITFSINYHQDKGDVWFYEDGRPKNEAFVGDQKQINIIIEQIMSDIENGLRFKIEKYFLNYYLISKNVLGQEYAGQDWSEFIEYGTTDKHVIELQNIGFSRGASKYLISEYGRFLSFTEAGELLDVKESDLLSEFDKKNEHYEEVKEVFRASSERE